MRCWRISVAAYIASCYCIHRRLGAFINDIGAGQPRVADRRFVALARNTSLNSRMIRPIHNGPARIAAPTRVEPPMEATDKNRGTLANAVGAFVGFG